MHALHKENLPVPASARAIHRKIESLLKDLLAADIPSPLHTDFGVRFSVFLSLFHRYQNEVLDKYSKQTTCRKGCCYCCNHWVEDVYSFEATRIADYIKTHFPERISSIIDRCIEDEKHIIRLHNIMDSKLHEYRSDSEIVDIDETDLLLASYYQLKRPCPLLNDNGTCSIYPARPLTCRVYFSFSDPQLCRPEYINTEEIPTYLLDLEEEANLLLDSLHEKYRRNEKSGLRALLIDFLR